MFYGISFYLITSYFKSEIIQPVGFTGTLDYFIFTILVFLYDVSERNDLIRDLPTIIYLSFIHFDELAHSNFYTSLN